MYAYSYIPDCSDLDIPEDTDYVYICENETIHGVTWSKLPNTKGHVLVSDQSSMFLSKPCNVSDYGMIYAGVQKNVGPAGMVVVIIREDLIREDIDPKIIMPAIGVKPIDVSNALSSTGTEHWFLRLP